MNSIVRTDEFKTAINNYVVNLNRIIRFAYLFARFIFVNELAYHTNAFAAFYGSFVNRDFFQEIIKTLGNVRRLGRDNTNRILIDNHLRLFLEFTGYDPEDAGNQVPALAHNASKYAAIRMETDYLNIVQTHFGHRLRQLINHVLDVKGLTAQVTQRMAGRPDVQVKAVIRQLITEPARDFKLAFTTDFLNRQQEAPELVRQGIFAHRWDFFDFLRDCYPAGYVFTLDSIYADADRNPRNSLYAFYTIAKLIESTRYLHDDRPRVRLFQCMPLRNSWIPKYIMIDSSIMRQVLLHETMAVLNANPLGTVYDRQVRWNTVFHVLGDRELVQENNQVGDFRMNAPDNAKRPFAQQLGTRRTIGPDDQVQRERVPVYFRGSMLTDGVGVSIIKSDVDTTADNERNAMARNLGYDEFFLIQEPRARNTDAFQQHNIIYLDPGRRDILFGTTHQSTPENKQTVRFTRNYRNQIYKTTKYKLILQAVRRTAPGQQPIAVNLAERQLSFAPNKASINPLLFNNMVFIRGQVDNVMQQFYTNTMTRSNKPLHRQLQLRSSTNRTKFFQVMANKLQQLSLNPQQRPHLVLGDHSLPNMRYHEPVPGLALRRRLQSFGFHVSLLNEYLTSQICPFCLNHQHRLENFRVCHNPRPPVAGRLNYEPLTIRWGLLRCSNAECQVNNGNRRILNRDMAAVLNFRTITTGYVQDGDLHPAFHRRRGQA
ncbi:hypothetical protein MBANPS3_009441 [Mucor bainieri]